MDAELDNDNDNGHAAQHTTTLELLILLQHQFHSQYDGSRETQHSLTRLAFLESCCYGRYACLALFLFRSVCIDNYGRWRTARFVCLPRRARSGEALWRRLDEFISQSPGCRQGTILAPVAARQLLPGSGAVSALGHFWNEDATRSRGPGSAPFRVA
jgi:hypothetical protein